MITRQEYNINTDNRRVCGYLKELIKLNNFLIDRGVYPYTYTINTALDYLQKLEHTSEYEDILKEITYYNLIRQADQIGKTYIIYDDILKRMNEHFKCDQIFPEIKSELEHTTEAERGINEKSDRIIRRILEEYGLRI